MRNFVIEWHEIKKKDVRRFVLIRSNEPSTAVDIFMKNFGNLKKNEIVSIQEVDEVGDAIGEPIVPAD